MKYESSLTNNFLTRDGFRHILFIIFSLSCLFLLTGCNSIKESSTDITKMLANLETSLPDIRRFITAVAFLMGFVMFCSGIARLKIFGMQRTMMPVQAHLAATFGKLIVGVMLISLPTWLKISTYTFFGTTYFNTVTTGLFPADFAAAEHAMFELLAVIGLVSFVRGLFLLKNAVQQNAPQGTMGKGVIFLVGGLFLVNIGGVFDIIKNTLGL